MSYNENRISDQIDGGISEKAKMQTEITKLKNRVKIWAYGCRTAWAFLAFYLLTQIACAQDVRTTLGTFMSGAVVEDGFNIGFDLDYQRTVMYTKAQIFYYPGLRGKDYFHAQGTLLGFNQHLRYDSIRIYEGFKGGVVRRDGGNFYSVGFEVGVQWYIDENWYIGYESSYDNRHDGKVWEAHAEPYWRLSHFAKVGIKL